MYYIRLWHMELLTKQRVNLKCRILGANYGDGDYLSLISITMKSNVLYIFNVGHKNLFCSVVKSED
jgi:hypothetical protein